MADAPLSTGREAQAQPSQRLDTPAGKRVVLHMGIGKTGSSALQVAFVRNREQLAKVGVHYPQHGSDTAALRGEAMTGNGLDLARVVSSEEDDESATSFMAALRRSVEQSEQDTVLFSSEILFRYRAARLGQLRRALRSSGIALQGVLYVRDVAGHALSSYSQAVKRRLFREPLMSYLSNQYRLRLRMRLERLQETLGAQNLLVLHYDSARRRLFDDFMQQVFNISETGSFELTLGQINRSLTRSEIEMMRYVNAAVSDQVHARRISDALISQPPLGVFGTALTQAESDVLRERFDDDVRWVNDHFFIGEPLQVVGDGVTIVDELGVDDVLSDTEHHLLDALVEVARRDRSG